ncbi:PP2C family protein-serine/threonine phosphatase [Miltoncostaea marina]|uniref:PP2C family protein-serine/threonine phosphatase n=1 Tax=Miltoncostaea marina TaxID=2843215 RepID=UPI001C3DEF4F|nr:SpoIIE family protein phosphatase [Miltoncostaea marina]
MRRLRGPGSLRGVLAGLVGALAVVLTLLITVALTGMVTTAREYREGAQTALERQRAANGLLIDLLSAQSANRAYILLARGEDLAAYTTARSRYPGVMDDLRAVLAGEAPLEASAEAVDRTASLWFQEAVELIRLRRQGRIDEAVDRVDQGLSEARFNAFRAEHARLLEAIEQVRLDGLRDNDRRRRLTFYAIAAAALLTLIMVAVVSRQVWRRVGGPVALLSAGVTRVTRGRLSDPIPARREAVRELAELMEGFNLMQREVRQERDAVAAAARREAAQKTERELWETVQHGLLPARLPGVRGLRLAARYRPAERALLVGGDFYDAMVLPDGRLAVMVGDMAGHGASSAAQAAGLRFGWRTLVSVDPDPAKVLAGLNAQMGSPEQRAEGLFASIIYMLIDERGSVSFAPAGHPPPIVMTDGSCQPLEPARSGPLLGVFDAAEWPVTRTALPYGGTIVLYTDGLIEARQGADTFGVERACVVLEAERRSALELRVERMIEAARRHEDQSLRDDVVVLAVERPRPAR